MFDTVREEMVTNAYAIMVSEAQTQGVHLPYIKDLVIHLSCGAIFVITLVSAVYGLGLDPRALR